MAQQLYTYRGVRGVDYTGSAGALAGDAIRAVRRRGRRSFAPDANCTASYILRSPGCATWRRPDNAPTGSAVSHELADEVAGAELSPKDRRELAADIRKAAKRPSYSTAVAGIGNCEPMNQLLSLGVSEVLLRSDGYRGEPLYKRAVGSQQRHV